jgi:hypothetical protein
MISPPGSVTGASTQPNLASLKQPKTCTYVYSSWCLPHSPSGSQFCIFHKCDFTRCLETASGDTGLCDFHSKKCSVTMCQAYAIPGDSFLCQRHLEEAQDEALVYSSLHPPDLMEEQDEEVDSTADALHHLAVPKSPS